MTLSHADAVRLCDEMAKLIGPMLNELRDRTNCGCFACGAETGQEHYHDCLAWPFIRWRANYEKAKERGK